MALQIGLQLYSIKEAMAKDPVQAIKDVAAVGYKNLELANLNAEKDFGCGFNVSASELKKVAEDCGANIFSAHIDPLNDDNLHPVLEYHAELARSFS